MNRSSSLLRTAILSQVSKRTKAYTGPLKDSMNDIPRPSGSFQVNYDAQQKKFMGILVGGITFSLITFGFGYTNDCFFLNMTPRKPADKNDYSLFV